ncbi:DUF2975 domain-containing protein [Pedobacter jeongneungensis]|uniref:DUF2975 domain-containing protein n=1 Tax=Pedobacter jeongneungensis TaxID=947309 RepID=UPI000468AAD6|nr:DUF2975 domain-containing protein [Pedobacter jeongneungensis]
MKNKASINNIISIMKLLTWIVFIGLCIKTGSLIVSFIVSLTESRIAAKDLYMGLDLSQLLEHSPSQYVTLMLLLIFCWAAKAFLFFIAIKIFLKINLDHPFSDRMATLIINISFVSLVIGILAIVASAYSDELIREGLMLPTLQPYLAGGAEFLFLAGILFIISLVFKKGIQIQTENDLTV